MHINLTPELEQRIAEKVESGLYASPEEVVAEGLKLLFESDQAQTARLARLQEKIAIGVAQLDRGETVSGEQAFDRVTRTILSRRG